LEKKGKKGNLNFERNMVMIRVMTRIIIIIRKKEIRGNKKNMKKERKI